MNKAAFFAKDKFMNDSRPGFFIFHRSAGTRGPVRMVRTKKDGV
jgi:hypothetical protein